MTEIMRIRGDERTQEQRRRRAERERRNPDLPRPGEDFANYHRRSRGSQALERYFEDRGVPSAEHMSSERGQQEWRDRQFYREHPVWRNVDPTGGSRTLSQMTANEAVRRMPEERRGTAPPTNPLRPPLDPRIDPRDRDRMTVQREAGGAFGDPVINPNIAGTAAVAGARDVAFVQRDPFDIAARVTGAPRGYLRALARQEGLDDANAVNPRSGASGLMQFMPNTWLAMLRDHGADYGLPRDVISQIERKEDGSYTVRDARLLEQLLRMRFNPQWSALMGAHLFNREAETIARRVGGPIQVAEVYMGHFLGGEAGGWWIRQVRDGRGSMNARQAIRSYYARAGNAGFAELVIQQNPRQFGENATIASVYRMQTEDLIEHGRRNGVDPGEMRAIVATSSARR